MQIYIHTHIYVGVCLYINAQALGEDCMKQQDYVSISAGHLTAVYELLLLLSKVL